MSSAPPAYRLTCSCTRSSRGPEIVEELRRQFGDKVIADGDIDRAALARVVFRDADALDWLESLLHPHVKRLVDEWAREQERSPSPPPLDRG